MRINTRFPVAVHILAVISLNENGENTSEWIAKSVGTNPVVIRRINSMLKKAGLITVKSGVGGTALNRAPEAISLLEVYNAVKTSSDALLFDLHTDPNPLCPIGANIHDALSLPLTNAQTAMEQELGRYTVRSVAQNIEERIRKRTK